MGEAGVTLVGVGCGTLGKSLAHAGSVSLARGTTKPRAVQTIVQVSFTLPLASGSQAFAEWGPQASPLN